MGEKESRAIPPLKKRVKMHIEILERSQVSSRYIVVPFSEKYPQVAQVQLYQPLHHRVQHSPPRHRRLGRDV